MANKMKNATPLTLNMPTDMVEIFTNLAWDKSAEHREYVSRTSLILIACREYIESRNISPENSQENQRYMNLY